MTKRDQHGRFDYKNDWDRLCVCGHTLGVHSAGSPAECLLYSFGDQWHQETQDHQHQPDKNCGCEKFRPKRKNGKNVYLERTANV